MGKVLVAIVAAFASLVVVESLGCNQCRLNVLGQCISMSIVNCSSNNSVCYNDRYSLTIFSSSLMFNSTGCREDSSTCNNMLSDNFTSVTNVMWSTTTDCCTTDLCNNLILNSAPSTKMTFTVAAAAAVLASVWGSML